MFDSVGSVAGSSAELLSILRGGHIIPGFTPALSLITDCGQPVGTSVNVGTCHPLVPPPRRVRDDGSRYSEYRAAGRLERAHVKASWYSSTVKVSTALLDTSETSGAAAELDPRTSVAAVVAQRRGV